MHTTLKKRRVTETF